jgi:hypothetical protein
MDHEDILSGLVTIIKQHIESKEIETHIRLRTNEKEPIIKMPDDTAHTLSTLFVIRMSRLNSATLDPARNRISI